jgi:hypothetical protein
MTSDDPRAQLPVPNRRAPYHGPAHLAPPLADDTGPVFDPPPIRRQRGDRGLRSDLGLIGFLVVAALVGIAAWNIAGSLTHGVLHPDPASRGGLAAASSAMPGASPSAAVPSATPAGSPATAPSPSADVAASPEPTATPRPERKPVNVKIERRPAAAFVSEQEKTWCAAAAVQMALNVIGPDVDTSRRRQVRVLELLREATTRRDSRNGGAGPLGMVATLERLGDVDYALHAYDTRAEALQASAKAIKRTGHPAILLAWRGAHAWVMTGFRADADPTVFRNAKVTGAYILDPWYPRVSSIWGPSDGPGVFQDAAEMRRNYLPWRRPEGHYPGRDGKFLAIVPTS